MALLTNRMRFAHCTKFICRLSPLVLFGVVSTLVCLSGCGKSSGKVAVHGHVSYRGTPLESAALTFFPTKGRPESTTVSNGEYSIELMPGEYSAIVLIGVNVPKGFKEGDPIPPPSVVLPETYTSQAKTSLKAAVAAGRNDPIDFELK